MPSTKKRAPSFLLDSNAIDDGWVLPPDPGPATPATAAAPPAAQPAPDKIDLNTATLEDLLRLPGVGRKKAERIIAWREQHDGFSEVADLARVSGFGPKAVDKLAALLTVAAK